MKLVILLRTDGTYIAYFDGTPNFYGSGKTIEEAVAELREMILHVLDAIARIQKGI